MERLEAALGYTFRDKGLLAQALTHTSASKATRMSNERLEFLGDRVLGLVIAHVLYQHYADESEGALAKRQARLVSRETLLSVADTLEVKAYLQVAANDAILKQARARGLLADAVEAIIAAVYVESGFDKAKGVVERLWQPHLTTDAAPPQDAKSALQEWAQARGLPTPSYTEKQRTGPAHRPEFVMEVSVQGHEAITASGASKKIAEQRAAEALLAKVQSL